MIRVGSQFTFCSPDKILRRMAVELDEQNSLRRLFSLDDGNSEPEQTLFFDGILSSGIVSLMHSIKSESLLIHLKDYNYFNFSDTQPSHDIIMKDKPLIIDFGTTLPSKINSLLPHLSQAFSDFSIFEIIAAFTYYPSKLLGITTGLTENNFTKLILWENVDLIKKELTVHTQIREMN